MISVQNFDVLTNEKYRFELFGLSTDTISPSTVGIDEDIAIANGSIFYEIDTGNMYVYNETGNKWINTDDASERS